MPRPAAALLAAAALTLLPEALAQPSGKRDRCERAQDPAYCEAQRAAAEGDCRGLARDEMRACVQDRLPPRRPTCRGSGTRRAECEFHREAVETCYHERGAGQRACLEAQNMRTFLREPFNPLDCGAPQPSVEARCGVWRRVEQACELHAADQAWKCALHFYPEWRLIPVSDCDKYPRGKGWCAVHNRGLTLCRGRDGAALVACVNQLDGPVFVSEARCGAHDLIPAERDYCQARDQALERCVDNLADAARMKRCVDDAIPPGIKAAMRAATFWRFGPVK